MAAPTIRVSPDPFALDAEMAALLHAAGPHTGGIGCFLGVVRADTAPNGVPLAALVLDHYPGMTETALRDLVDAATARFDLSACTIIHRVGRLPVGAPIVLVLAASAHRAAALDATAFLIDRLKTGAPFWKCGEYADGTRIWVEARDADAEAAARWLEPAEA